MKQKKLKNQEIQIALTELSGWELSKDGKAIEKKFEFKNFKEAFSFMANAALKAEDLNHHPQWSNVYKKVDVKLTTHDSDGITALDIELAAYMEKVSKLS